MRSYSDVNLHDDADGEDSFEPRTIWAEPEPDPLADASESPLGGDGGLRPWKTTDI
jgi:hypothetical protein